MTHEGKKRKELQKEIISELLTAPKFYLAAAENTKGEEWKAGNCEFYHSSDGRFVILLTEQMQNALRDKMESLLRSQGHGKQ